MRMLNKDTLVGPQTLYWPKVRIAQKELIAASNRVVQKNYVYIAMQSRNIWRGGWINYGDTFLNTVGGYK